MAVINESMNFNTRTVDSDGREIVTMNASITNEGTQVYIGKNIVNVDLYLSNKEAADADYAEFENTVLNKVR